jgi:cytochrome c biogenesis protein CcmG/thiol:disulfide interchange protein DsbE
MGSIRLDWFETRVRDRSEYLIMPKLTLKGQLATVLRVAALGWLLVNAVGPVQSQVGIMKPVKAPDFTFTTSSHKTISLKSLRGKVVLLDFWATWCAPCRQAVPELIGLQTKFRSRNFVVVGIAMDDASTAGRIKAYVAQYGSDYPIGTSFEENVQTARVYGAATLPTQVLIDKRGNVRWGLRGYSPSEGPGIAGLVKKLLAE